MAQFCVYRNPNPASKAAMPFLLNVQSDLIEDLASRVVVPLCRVSTMQGKPIKTLMPLFEIEGEQYAMLTPQLAGIAKRQMGTKVCSLSSMRSEIIAALDLLVTGV